MNTQKRSRKQLIFPSRSSSTRLSAIACQRRDKSHSPSGDETKQSRGRRFDSEPKWWTPVVQQRTGAADAVPERQAKAKSQSREFRRRSRFHNHILHKTRCDPKQKHEAGKDVRRIRYSQSVVRTINEAARGQDGSGDAGGSRTPQK